MTQPSARTCSNCGYDLTGLPPRGACPECGQYCDIFTGQGLGAAPSRSERSQRLANRLRTISLGMFTVMVLACGGGLAFIASDPLRPIALAGVIAAVGALATISSYLYEDE